MANIAHCTLTYSGAPDRIMQLKSLMGDGFDFSNIAPLPDSSDTYEWRKEHWGTAHKAFEVSVRTEHPDSVQWWFETTWSPPIPVIDLIEDRFPDLGYDFTFFIDTAPWVDYRMTYDPKSRERVYVRNIDLAD